MTKLSRAQTPEEKVAKGEFILQVAERIIRDEGLEALSMNRLVQETGLPDDTYAQVSLALQQVLGEQAEVFKDTLDLTDQLASNLVWAFYTAALGAAQFPQSPNMLASVSFEVREFQEALQFDTLFRNLVDQFAP